MARARLYKQTTSINIDITDIFQKNIAKYRYEKMFDIPITNGDMFSILGIIHQKSTTHYSSRFANNDETTFL